jgi:RHS repeat-associated protein
MSGGGAAQAISSVGNDADTITPEIQALAENLSKDILAIHRYVTHNIQFEAYYGSKRGANLTLLEKRGNAHDQCSLLVALLRAAGHEANYIIGPSVFHYSTLEDMLGFSSFPLPEQSDAQILALFGGSLPAGFTYLQARQLLNTSNFLAPRGYPIVSYVDGDNMVFDHVWAEVIVGEDSYFLNPSIKASFAAQPIDALAESGYNAAAFLTSAGGTAGSGAIGDASVHTINEASIDSQLTALTSNFSNWMRDNRPNISAADLLGKRSILPREIPNLQSLFPFTAVNTQWATVLRYAEMPETEMSRFELRMGDYNYSTKAYSSEYHTETILMPSLSGQKLSLTFSGDNATFKLDETPLHVQAIPSNRDRLDMDITATHNHFNWVWNGSAYVKTNVGRNNGFSNTQKYLVEDDYAYVIPYAFKPSGELLRKRQAVLDEYLRDGLTDSSEVVRTEVLNVMGLTWMYQTSLADDVIVAHEDIDLAFLHRIGRVAQEDSYYIDVFMQYYAGQSRSTSSNVFLTLPTSQLLHSAYEHAVVEHLQAGNAGAASTIKLLHLANQTGTTIYRVNSSNWQAGPNIRNLVTGYSADELAVIDDTVNASGGNVLLPQNGNITLGDWEGAGFILRRPGFVTMGISGGLSGGFNSVTGQVEFAPIVIQGHSDPAYWENGSSTQNVGYTPIFLERYFGADPVDMATGAFVMEKSELELGQAMPRGLRFSRYFHGNRRYDTSPGLGGGWIHNLHGKAVERTSTKGSLGLTTARHVIPTLIATAVTRDLVDNDSGSAKYQAVAALVAQWASEQITDNAVGIVLGEKTLEFVLMPDGSYEAPPGSTLSLVKNGSGEFELSERNALTMAFLADGWIESVIDPHGNQTTFAYSGDKLSTVTDAYGRTLTFTWSGTQITKVADSTAREVVFGYSTAGDLTAVTDVEGKAWSYTYTGDHQIETVLDPQSRIITQNTYDAQNRLERIRDKKGNDTDFTYTPTHLVETVTDPLGHVTTYGYYSNGLVQTVEDAEGKITTTAYDSFDSIDTITLHDATSQSFTNNPRGDILTSTDPLNRVSENSYNGRGEMDVAIDPADEETSFLYDNNGNRTQLTDRRGKVYTFAYDDANRLTASSTPTGKTTLMTYFDNNLVKTYTNEDGDTLQYRYNGNGNLTRLTYPDGKEVTYTYNARNLLETVTDWSGRVTTYNYDQLGRLIGITRPNGTSSVIESDAADQILSIKESANGRLFNLLRFDHDLAGQITSRFHAPIPDASFVHPTFAGTYDDDNRLLTVNAASVVHDDDGNMTSGAITSTSGIVSLGYNSRNQLTSADGVSYTYDAEGHRRTMTDASGTTRFVIDANANMSRLLVRHNPDGSETYFVYGLGLLYEADEDDNTKTYHFDQVGSTIARTDDAGQVIGRAEYSPYGLVTMETGDMETPFLYNGKWGIQTDTNGLLNMRARYYSPYLMRFINADPAGFSGGQNWFSYVGGDPISYTDPFGLVRWRDFGRAVLGMGVNALGMAVGVGVAAIPEPSMATVAIGGTLAVKSGYGFGANLSNATAALFDADPVSTGALTNDIAQAVAPGNRQAQQLATVVDLATDIGSARMISNSAISAVGKSPAAFPSLTLSHVRNPADLPRTAQALVGTSIVDSLIRNTSFGGSSPSSNMSAGFGLSSSIFNSNSNSSGSFK